MWHGVGDIRLHDLPGPTIHDPTDAIVEITASAICGSDPHFVRGTMAGMVDQIAVTSAFQQGSGRVLVVDGLGTRLDQARARRAEAIDVICRGFP